MNDLSSEVSPTATQVLGDRAASSWLRSALESALDRDPVDALNDALLLAAVLDTRLRNELGLEN